MSELCCFRLSRFGRFPPSRFPFVAFRTVCAVTVPTLHVSGGFHRYVPARHVSDGIRCHGFRPQRLERLPPLLFFPFRLDVSMLANLCARLRTNSIASSGVPSRRCEDVYENVSASSHKSKHQQLAALAAMLKFVRNCEQRVCV